MREIYEEPNNIVVMKGMSARSIEESMDMKTIMKVELHNVERNGGKQPLCENRVRSLWREVVLFVRF